MFGFEVQNTLEIEFSYSGPYYLIFFVSFDYNTDQTLFSFIFLCVLNHFLSDDNGSGIVLIKFPFLPVNSKIGLIK